MATYHLTVVPKAGENPPLSTRPLAPRDIAAGSDAEALEEGRSALNEAIGEWGEALYETKGEEAADRFYAVAALWQPQVRKVNRPIVEAEPRSWTTDHVLDGMVVGTLSHYGDETGEQSFDVLVGGTIMGILTEGRRIADTEEVRVWRLAQANGCLACLADRQWDDGRGLFVGFAWPEMALDGIRAELERS